MPIGFGILSWKGGETLKQSLDSYNKENLFSLFDENIIFLPEQRKEETNIASGYPLKICGHNNNLGILGGFKALAEALTSEVILLVENDCPLIVNHEEAKKQIKLGSDLLLSNKADVIRFRSRTNPGQDWGVNRKYRNFYPSEDSSLYEKTFKYIKRISRPKKAERLKGWSIYEGINEAKKFPDIVKYNSDHDYFSVLSSHLPWTNQSIMIKRDFFLNKIIEKAEKMDTKRRVNGFKNLEIEMNSSYWRNGNFKIIQPHGIFTHDRKGYRGYIIN